MPFGKNHYVASLERRVVELEEFLAKRGLLDQVPPFTSYNLSGRKRKPSYSQPGAAGGCFFREKKLFFQ
jgi:hypothetical protein